MKNTSGKITIANPNEVLDETNSGHGLRVTHYLEIDGEIDLVGESQLVQDDNSTLDEDSGGFILKSQQGTSNSYNYNYWSSSVGPIAGSGNSNYTISDTTKLFLTELTDVISVRTGADYYLSIITNAQSSLEAEIEFLDSDGVNITTYNEAIDASIKIVQLMLNLDKLVADGTITQAQADDTETIQVLIRQGVNEASEYKTFSINRECGNRGQHLIWLNHFGGFDQFTFIHNDTYTTKTTSQSYRKQFGNWSGNSFVLDAYNAGEIGYLVTSEDSLELVSDWLTEPVQNWLVRSSFEGVLVNTQTALTTYSRVTIDSNSYKLEDSFFEDLFNVIIKLKLSNSRRSPKI